MQSNRPSLAKRPSDAQLDRMPPSPDYRPEPRFFDLGDEYGDAVRAAGFPQAIPRFRNDRAAATVGLDALSDVEWIAHFARFEPLPGQPGPIAMRYHGHQFRTYNPDLGDGRGFLAAQLRADDGRLLDLGTKGSGTTAGSRSRAAAARFSPPKCWKRWASPPAAPSV